MANDDERCDRTRQSDNRRCPNLAEWWVQVGNRTTDRERSCANHLSTTCRAMWGAEVLGRGRDFAVTVRPL